MFKDDFFSHECKGTAQKSLLFVIKLQTKDFFVSDNLSAFFFKTEMIYRMVNRNLKVVKPAIKRCTFVMRNIGLHKMLSLTKLRLKDKNRF